MADTPDKAPPKKSRDTDDAWPNTMKHYKWEKEPAETDEPPPAEAPQADGEP